MKMIKCTVVGDSMVGKTALLISYTRNQFPPDEFLPRTFDHCGSTVMVGGEQYTLTLSDTASERAYDYDRLKALSYPETDIFLVCFSVVSPNSFANVSQKWVPEIKRQCPKTRFILVGTNIDRRDDAATLAYLAKDKKMPITLQQGKELARDLKAVKYVECSAITKEGLKNVFEKAVEAAMKPPPKDKTRCDLL